MVEFGWATTGNDIVHAFPDQVQNRTFLITGSSVGGIGAETAISLAQGSPSQIILLGRSLEKTQPVIEAIQAVGASIRTKFVQVDLDSLSSVRRAAAEVNEDPKIPQIDVMFLNAGIMALPTMQLTKDGFEAHFGTNHLSHFLLCNLLMPKLLAAVSPESKSGNRAPHIVLSSSYGNIFSPVRFDDWNFQNGKVYDPWQAYGASKTANVLMAMGLNARFRSQGIYSYAICPGSVATNLRQYVDDATMKKFAENEEKFEFKRPERKNLQQGCATMLRAALDPSLPVQRDVLFLSDTKPLLVGQNLKVLANHSADAQDAQRLWGLSNQLVGETF